MENEIEIPDGASVELEGKTLKAKGPKGEVSRSFKNPLAQLKVEGDKVIIETKGESRSHKRMLGTYTAHVKNMLKGVVEGYTYKLGVCQTHFPIRVKAEGSKVVIENFLGERQSRTAKVMEGAEVKVEDDNVIVTSADKEAAGQTAANIELASKIKRKDRRVFGDGIFIIRRRS